jgi:hypothetical protein
LTTAKPLIGVTSFIEEARWGHWSALAHGYELFGALVGEARRYGEEKAP